MEIVLPKDFEADDAPQVLARARPVLELPPDAQLRVENVTRTARGTRIDFSYTTCLELDDDIPKDVAGIRIEIRSHGDLQFNARGEMIAHEVEPADPRQLRAIRDHLSKLVASGQVYVAKPGETVDPDQLRAQGKPWYVEWDAEGKKHLKRAWMS